MTEEQLSPEKLPVGFIAGVPKMSAIEIMHLQQDVSQFGHRVLIVDDVIKPPKHEDFQMELIKGIVRQNYEGYTVAKRGSNYTPPKKKRKKR